MAEHQLEETFSNRSTISIRKLNSYPVESVNKIQTKDLLPQSFKTTTTTNPSNFEGSNLSLNEQIILNDFILLKNSDESNGTAYHTKKKKTFLWKVNNSIFLEG